MSSLPALPPKALPVASVSMSSKLVARRRDGLEKFSRALAKLPSAMSNVTVLSFLGIVNSARQDEEKVRMSDSCGRSESQEDVSSALLFIWAPCLSITSSYGGSAQGNIAISKLPHFRNCSDFYPFAPELWSVLTSKLSPTMRSLQLKKKDKKAENRNVIHVSQLRGMLKWGDLILFRCANPVSATQRLATGAEWDHVALVVKRRGGRNLELLEVRNCCAPRASSEYILFRSCSHIRFNTLQSTGDGVQCYNLISR